MSRSSVGRIAFGALPPLVAVVPAVVLLLTGADRLPDPLAVHFDLGGVPDGFSSPTAALWSVVAPGVLLAVTFGALVALRTTRFLAGIGWGAAGLIGTVLFLAVRANLDAADASDARLSLGALLIGVAVAAAAGVLGAFLAPDDVIAAEPETRGGTMDLAPGERVAWSRSVTSAPMQGLGIGLVIVGVGVGVVVEPGSGILAGTILAVAGLLVLLSASARVTVDERGLTVSLGPVGFPRWHLPLAEVGEAVAGEISALGRFGGYGYRVVPGGSGVILRSGESLIVTRASGRTFTVTVDDAGTAARLLTGLVARSGA
ncbi:MAG: DUF1648 domain-containing protein [Pseudonocardia sp.]|nr:DUF1648 domain-containing protein [Pseudonocardia sp.]